jgi:hypothetical protein
MGKEMGRHMRAERLGHVRWRTTEPTMELTGVARSRALEITWRFRDNMEV